MKSVRWPSVAAACVLIVVGIARTQEPAPKTIATSAQAPVPAAADKATPSEHLRSKSVDLPAGYKLDSSNGLAIDIKESDAGVDMLLRFYGYRHASGAVKMTRILLHFPRGKEILNIADCREVLYEDKQTLDCLGGYFVVDRQTKKIELDLVVFDKGDWHRFGWNGVWKYEGGSDMDISAIRENMGHKAKP